MSHSAARADYTFTSDWFSQNIPLFEQWLEPLRDVPCALMEIGSYEGRSATWLVDNLMADPQSKLDCVDLRIQDLLRANIALTGRAKQVSFHHGYSRSILRTLPEGWYDFVYIDGNHWSCEVMEDAVLAFGLVVIGGIMAFDDYLLDDPQYCRYGAPKPAIDAFLDLFARKIEILHKGYQVWVRKISD